MHPVEAALDRQQSCRTHSRAASPSAWLFSFQAARSRYRTRP
jgi:hypothetical protein